MITLFKDVWSLQINFALFARALMVDSFTCCGWFDEKWVCWPVWVGFLYTFVTISLFSFKLMMHSRNGKFPSDAFSIVNLAMSFQDHVMLLQLYCQLFLTIDETCSTLCKHDFLPLFEYKFLWNMVKLVHLRLTLVLIVIFLINKYR